MLQRRMFFLLQILMKLEETKVNERAEQKSLGIIEEEDDEEEKNSY